MSEVWREQEQHGQQVHTRVQSSPLHPLQREWDGDMSRVRGEEERVGGRTDEEDAEHGS